ncbi:Oligosaccharyltransferase [Klebsormidium nitens]|uniref:Dolichyl-diphosphooligosaccharide--protein glycosyltransferase 48 kDa subunit n=1 Tax=Klebsormidium nitens TaxID=105231 RepID=A0A1Y1HTT8_KLENI|nr:Oligosaccharyltransferase [Klebsormidium nitens]|eukprot:GAQ81543.1 Oligosaccharyltransferase [Klebsormidium nitens]
MAALGKPLLLVVLLAVAAVHQVGAFSEETPTDQRILVLLDDFGIKATHSMYFKSLTDRGYDLHFKLADDASLALQKYGAYLYDALIFFAPTFDVLGGSLDVAVILDFIDSGHDVVLAAEGGASDVVRDIATECGVDLEEEENAVVVDHVNHSSLDADHTIVAASDLIQSKAILGPKTIEAPVLFRGLGMSVNPSNELVVKVLTAPPTTFSSSPSAKVAKVPTAHGRNLVLVAALQARNHARVLVSGSLDLFSDKFFLASVEKKTPGAAPTNFEKSGNEQFAVEATKWTLHERGHLRATNVRHHKVDEVAEGAVYRIRDEVEYSLDIQEWDGAKWVPYHADDVQLQFFLMSPYVRKALTSNKKGHFSTTFQIPDVYGVFQFKVDYHRLGYTDLNLAKQIPVRPFKHNEYERFIGAAYPYYSSAFSLLFAFVIFGVVFLYNK